MIQNHPIIGCTTYRKTIPQDNPIDVYGLMPSYTEAIVAAGGIPILIPLGLSDDDLDTIFNRIDGLVLPGGGDVEPKKYKGQYHRSLREIDDDRDRTEIVLSRRAVRARKPMLAICRGVQVVNVALGGTLWEDISSLIPDAINHENPNGKARNHLAHTIQLNAQSGLAQHMGKLESWVNSYHHQAIRDLASELNVTATAPDGVIEAAEVVDHPFAIGVQWHPENLIRDDPAMLELFKGLVRAANEMDRGD